MLFGRVIVVKPIQSSNAYSPIQVTLLGKVIEVSPLRPQKASLSIPVIPFGITVAVPPNTILLFAVSIIALQPLRESKTVLFSSTLMVAKLLQCAKADTDMLVTPLWILNDSIQSQL